MNSSRRTFRWNGLWRKGAGTSDDPNNGRLISRVTRLNFLTYWRWFDNWPARMRGTYWWLLRRYETELCDHCGRPVGVVYHAPDDLWELATGHARFPDGQAAPGCLCPKCLDDLVDPKVDGYLTWTCEVTR